MRGIKAIFIVLELAIAAVMIRHAVLFWPEKVVRPSLLVAAFAVLGAFLIYRDKG